MGFWPDGVHIFNNVCLCIFLQFSAIRRHLRSPGTRCSPKLISRLDGVHISTKANFQNVWTFSKHMRASKAGGSFWSPGLSPGGFRPPSGSLPAPKGPQRHPKRTPRTWFGSSGLSLGGPRAPVGRPPGPRRNPSSGASQATWTKNNKHNGIENTAGLTQPFGKSFAIPSRPMD